MKQKLVLGCYVAAGLLALPVAADAQSQAYTTSRVNVRAGPASDYPIVTQLPGGVPVSVMGCLSNYQWCDVATPNVRGWVYASLLSSPYQGGNVPLMNYGAAIGLPILAFSLSDYWGNHYRGQPWYGQQSRWARHAPPPAPRPGAGHPPNWQTLPGHVGGPPPGHGGGRPQGNAGGRPPGNEGNRPPGHAGGRPPGGQGPGGQPPGHAGNRPEGGPPGNAGNRPPGGGAQGGGGNRPPGGGAQGGGNRPPGGGGGGGNHPPGGGNN
ncbi:peptide-binding protein [Burkholderia sp. SRS-W-2-2016]|uniref:SH3 domain-containing protein n=1 Tax=Burkholderia sp. SRS-W-2-2016 TaxID=1926878 RepID=UPI00094B489C|nr:SH3 domain-containing protein [Burkholderia sp. SRS-W-2-2016]OLL30453.1 peptide-binding protein [Burkholderia sp. SRS-W-2-2016]